MRSERDQLGSESTSGGVGRWISSFLAIHLVVLVCPLIASPGTQPTTQSIDSASDLKTWFSELANPDAKVRSEAIVQLMGLKAQELPRLRQLVEESRPLAAEQAAALRQIVTQVFLASDPYDAKPEDGFLGIFLPPFESVSTEDGAVVVERMPGFVGMRMLRDGDVILGIVERPTVPIHSGTDLTTALKDARPGTTLRFQVLRQGQIVQVPITLDPRPVEAEKGADAMRDFNRQRREHADQYWDQHFANLVREGVS